MQLSVVKALHCCCCCCCWSSASLCLEILLPEQQVRRSRQTGCSCPAFVNLLHEKLSDAISSIFSWIPLYLRLELLRLLSRRKLSILERALKDKRCYEGGITS